MLALARCGRHGEAAAIADVIRGEPNRSPQALILGAGGYALCLAALQHPKANPAPGTDRSKLAERYTAAALECVRRAVNGGWKDAVTLDTDPELEPIRHDPEFVALIQKLKPASTPGKAP